MYKIKTNLDVNGIGWGLDFKHGVAFTDREDLARRLKSLGYEVEDMTQKPVKVSAPAQAAAIEPSTASNEASDTAPEESAPAQAAAATAEGGAEKLKCPICGKECGSQAVLTRHTNKEHG